MRTLSKSTEVSSFWLQGWGRGGGVQPHARGLRTTQLRVIRISFESKTCPFLLCVLSFNATSSGMHQSWVVMTLVNAFGMRYATSSRSNFHTELFAFVFGPFCRVKPTCA